jgi:hypothetical protein
MYVTIETLCSVCSSCLTVLHPQRLIVGGFLLVFYYSVYELNIYLFLFLYIYWLLWNTFGRYVFCLARASVFVDDTASSIQYLHSSTKC